MTSLYRELAYILNEEKKLLSEIYSVVSKEREAIVALNSKELARILIDKEALLIKISLWEKEREKLLKQHGLEGRTISEILTMQSGQEDREEISVIEETYKIMKSLLSGIMEIQKINEQLIDSSIIHIGTAIKFFESFGIKPEQTLSREA